jgi:hypothetical protein
LRKTGGKCTVPPLGLKPELISQPYAALKAPLFHVTARNCEFFRNI